jgi:hypothetical protein
MTDEKETGSYLVPYGVARGQHVDLLKLALAAYFDVEMDHIEVFPASLTRALVEKNDEGIVAHIVGMGALILYREELEEDELVDVDP